MQKTKLAAPTAVPRHVAIIMDGNNRWAKKRLLPGVAGHKAGVDAVRAVIEVCAEAKVEVLTLFAFSSENWQRPAEEVGALMELFFTALRRETKRLNENGISLRIIGDRSRFHPELQAAIREAEARTAGNDRFVLQIAANYGGQWDIAQAAQHLRLGEELQGSDEGEDEHHHHRRADHRHLDTGGRLPAVGSVDARGLIDRGVHSAQGRVDDDHVVARPLPRDDVDEAAEDRALRQEVGGGRQPGREQARRSGINR